MKIFKMFFCTAIILLSSQSVSAQIEWVAHSGELPSNVVIGGVETHRSLAVCRADNRGAMHAGKVVDNACNIGWGGKELIIKDYEILVNKGVVELDWLKTDGTLPEHAIQAGKERGGPIYVGRAHHEGGTHPGKVFKAGGKYICNIGYGGKELTLTTFEVLVVNQSDDKARRIKHSKQCDMRKQKSTCVGTYIGSMGKNNQIEEGTSLVSTNINYQTRVTDDGRLVVEEILDRALCDDGRILVFKTNEIWSNTTQGGDSKLDYYLKFQQDGNLCIYSNQNGFVWCSMSDGHHLEITNIGHLEVVNDHGGEVWPD